MLATTRSGIALPLSLVFLVSTAALPGCNKIQELTGKKEDTPAESDSKTAEADAKTGTDAKAEEKQAEVAPIPVEPMLSGLDAMLAFVPDDKAEFMIVRDASVLAEYAEEGTKFIDGPLAALSTEPGMPQDFAEAAKSFAEVKAKSVELIAALAKSGIRPKEGGAVIKTGGKSLIVFAGDNPNGLADLVTALEVKDAGTMKCKALEGKTGWNACADDQATLDAYKAAGDPAAIRKLLTDRLPGVNLDESNMLMNVAADGTQVAAAVATLPGLVHVAMAMPAGKEADEIKAALAPGEAKTLAQVQPGAGFIWGKINPAKMTEAMAKDMGGMPPDVASMFKSLNGEFVLAGSIDPGGLLFQAGMTDTSGVPKIWDMVMAEKAKLPTTIPEVKDSTLTWEKVQVQGGGASADAIHVAMGGLPEAGALKSYAGINLESWSFAHNNMLTIAMGPDSAGAGKILEKGAGGLHADTLAALPHQLSEAFGKNEVSFAAHLPMDFLHGSHMRKVIEASLKDVPSVKPSTVNAILGFAAPFSSATAWIAQPSGSTVPVIHLAVQGIGNRATDEGKAALAAAQKVAGGGDPAVEFASLASGYGSSPMSFAYHARAGDQGPGALVGSGVGAAMIAGFVVARHALGASKSDMAADLGVTPEAPPPTLEIPTKPVAPTHEPKTEPKEPKKPKPVEPKKPVEPVKPVEPDKPVEPVKPTPDPKDVPKPTPDPKDPKKPVDPKDPKTPKKRTEPFRPPVRPGPRGGG